MHILTLAYVCLFHCTVKQICACYIMTIMQDCCPVMGTATFLFGDRRPIHLR